MVMSTKIPLIGRNPRYKTVKIVNGMPNILSVEAVLFDSNLFVWANPNSIRIITSKML
jgi:hypothetical protein